MSMYTWTKAVQVEVVAWLSESKESRSMSYCAHSHVAVAAGVFLLDSVDRSSTILNRWTRTLRRSKTWRREALILVFPFWKLGIEAFDGGAVMMVGSGLGGSEKEGNSKVNQKIKR